MSITHAFVSPITDDAEADIVGPDDWNADHDFTGLTSGAIIAPSSDTYIRGSGWGSDTNQDATGHLEVGGDPWGGGTWANFALMTFDLSSLSGKTIYGAVLQVCIDQSLVGNPNAIGGNGALIQIRECLRAYNATQVTYANYATGSAWTSSGGQSSGNDISATRYCGLHVNNRTSKEMLPFDLAELVAKKAGSTLRIMFGVSATLNSQNQIGLHSLESSDAEARPKLRVVYG